MTSLADTKHIFLVGKIDRNIGHPILQLSKTTCGSHAVRALCTQRDYKLSSLCPLQGTILYIRSFVHSFIHSFNLTQGTAYSVTGYKPVSSKTVHTILLWDKFEFSHVKTTKGGKFNTFKCKLHDSLSLDDWLLTLLGFTLELSKTM